MKLFRCHSGPQSSTCGHHIASQIIFGTHQGCLAEWGRKGLAMSHMLPPLTTGSLSLQKGGSWWQQQHFDSCKEKWARLIGWRMIPLSHKLSNVPSSIKRWGTTALQYRNNCTQCPGLQQGKQQSPLRVPHLEISVQTEAKKKKSHPLPPECCCRPAGDLARLSESRLKPSEEGQGLCCS